MCNPLITSEEIAMLDKLFDAWDSVSIRTDEDYKLLGEMFDEDE
jgi:hypothetical protein